MILKELSNIALLHHNYECKVFEVFMINLSIFYNITREKANYKMAYEIVFQLLLMCVYVCVRVHLAEKQICGNRPTF